MTDATAEFFEGLGERSPEPLLGNTRGTLRFDLSHGSREERWLVSIDRGRVSVSQKGGKTADCIVRVRQEVFDRIVIGQLNAFAAVLRGLLDVEGDPRLLVRFQRLLPSPPRTAT